MEGSSLQPAAALLAPPPLLPNHCFVYSRNKDINFTVRVVSAERGAGPAAGKTHRAQPLPASPTRNGSPTARPLRGRHGAPRPVPGCRNTAGPRGSYRPCPPPARPPYLAQGLPEVPEGSAVPAPPPGHDGGAGRLPGPAAGSADGEAPPGLGIPLLAHGEKHRLGAAGRARAAAAAAGGGAAAGLPSRPRR